MCRGPGRGCCSLCLCLPRPCGAEPCSPSAPGSVSIRARCPLLRCSGQTEELLRPRRDTGRQVSKLQHGLSPRSGAPKSAWKSGSEVRAAFQGGKCALGSSGEFDMVTREVTNLAQSNWWTSLHVHEDKASWSLSDLYARCSRSLNCGPPCLHCDSISELERTHGGWRGRFRPWPCACTRLGPAQRYRAASATQRPVFPTRAPPHPRPPQAHSSSRQGAGSFRLPSS